MKKGLHRGSKTSARPPTIVWFQRELRVADNPALLAAIERGHPVVPLFVWSPEEEGDWRPGDASRWWLRRSLQELDSDLASLRSRLILMAHNQQGMRRIGGLLARPDDFPTTRALAAAHWNGFSDVMKRTPSRRNHTNALGHIAGYVSDKLDAGDRKELTGAIENYRLEQLPLIVPITLLRHYVRRLGEPYLEKQVYLNPPPDALMFLNQL